MTAYQTRLYLAALKLIQWAQDTLLLLALKHGLELEKRNFDKR